MSGYESIEGFPLVNRYATCIYAVFSGASYWALHVAVKPYCFRFQGVNNVKKNYICTSYRCCIHLCRSIPFLKCFIVCELCHASFIFSAYSFSVPIACRPVKSMYVWFRTCISLTPMVSAEMSYMQLLLEANVTIAKEAVFQFALLFCVYFLQVTQSNIAEVFRVVRLRHGISSLPNAGSACVG
uniref:Uncharacterized protein n=1 Tax=Rhipicephalus zambeziensis TaxID=60191 RepID=A0A224YB61_9ACAR